MTTPYNAGLSDIPDQAVLYENTYGLGATPLTAVAGSIPGIGALVNGGTLVGDAIGLLTGSGSADQQRQARVNYFLGLAESGNVAAAQVLLGGTQNTASHERPMYNTAITQLQDTPVGSQVLAQAQQAGPFWSTSDSASNYPVMRNFVQTWANQNSIGGALSYATQSGATSLARTTTQIPGIVWLVGAGAVAVLLLRRPAPRGA